MDVAVIGLGLIGGSVLRALAAHGHRVTGYDLGEQTRESARALAHAATVPRSADPGTRTIEIKGAWRVADSIADAVAGTDLVVLAVPLPALAGVLADLDGYPGLITDVTSVQSPVRDLLAGRRFVGGHPMAGTAASGFLASDPHLFDDCAWVLCLEPGRTDLADWLSLARLWTGLGARVVPVTAADHDHTVAQVSHVPHLLAAALSTVLAGNPLAGTLAAGSFRDGTRVAGTRPELIAAMCGGNAEAVRAVLTTVIGELTGYDRRLAEADPIAALTGAVRSPSELRQGWPPKPGDSGTLVAEPEALLALGRDGGWVTAVQDDLVQVMRPGTDRNRS